MSVKSNSKISQPMRKVAANVRRLLGLAWKMDASTTFKYYFTTAIGALVPLGASLMIKLLIDRLQLAQGVALATTISLAIVIFLAGRYLINLIGNIVYWSYNQSYLDYLFRNKLQNEITQRFHRKLSEMDLAHFEDPKVQELLAKTRDTMQWRLPDVIRTSGNVFRDIVAYMAAFVALWSFGWWIPVIVTVIAIPRLYLKAKYGSLQWSIWGSGAPQVRKLWYFFDLLQRPETIRETRISQSGPSLLKKFRGIQDYLFELNKKPLRAYWRVSSIPLILEIIVVFWLTYMLLPSVIAGVVTIGSFTLFLSMVEELNWRSAEASAALGDLYQHGLYIDHYFTFLSLPPLLKRAACPVVFPAIKPPRIEFQDVSFRYPSGRAALQHVSFVIEPGESVALVGHNGAGKTTIVKLLCRFYDPTEGKILVNGHDLKNLDLENWYKFLGTLFQEFVHYHFSVKDNITLGAPEKKDEAAVIVAARKAGADKFIETLPRKYEQMLGKDFADGEELSTGQWQKLAIARAFYEQPPVLILDEPTSAIDAESEYEIFSNLEKHYQHKTLVLVSHRFSTVRNANKIMVIKEGRIIEQGTHKQLMQCQGQYARMFELQAEGYR